ncbi:MAG TPA: protease complex subunit PrcB family protein [Pyrinomonadaceae bacterium]|nr:protease complex subunit PrcB family protein [Pyrinomonadaceae bacterium]
MRFRNHMLLAGVSLTLLCLFSSFSSAETLSGRIKGIIKDDKGALVADACVLIERHVGELPPERDVKTGVPEVGQHSLAHKMITSYQNQAAFEAKVPAGAYRLRVLAWGYNEFTSEPFRLSPGASKRIDIILQTSWATQGSGPTDPPLENPLITSRGEGVKRLMKFKTIWSSTYSGIRQRGNVLITNAKDWEGLWQKVHSTVSHRPELPQIDFEKSMVIASFYGEMNTGGYGVEIVRLVEGRDSLDVWVRRYGGGGIVTQAFTQPLHLIETERVHKKITFVTPRYEPPCR